MVYTLTLANGNVLTFYILAVAELYKSLYGGTIKQEYIEELEHA